MYMKKFILSFLVVGSFALYAVFYGSSSNTLSYVNVTPPTTLVKNTNITNIKTKTVTPPTQSVALKKTTPTPKTIANNGIFKNGEYTGTPAKDDD